MLVHKGYIGAVKFDDEALIFHGDVINTRDVITFQGTTAEELKQAFIDSVEDYLEFCSERGESPEKPYSGKFNLRLKPALHKQVDLIAHQHHTSINNWIESAIISAIKTEGMLEDFG